MTTPASTPGTRAFLILSVLVWLPYGIYCFLVPGGLADYAGVVGRTATGSTELRAMYGGLEAAIGVFALVALVRPALTRPFVLASAFLCSGLLLARASGLALDGGFSGYTAGALLFELAGTTWAITILRATPPSSA
jgi:hypothetical protein